MSNEPSTSPAEPHRLLFVCTANICRSPMGEAFAREYAIERQWLAESRSCGVSALPDNEAARRSVRAMAEIGVDISAHRSQPVTAELVAWATHILVMEIRHASSLHERFPECDGKVMMLGNFGGVMEIEDPYGAWFMPRYRTCRDELQRCVAAFMDRLPPRPVTTERPPIQESE